jgi:hypothetical protein
MLRRRPRHTFPAPEESRRSGRKQWRLWVLEVVIVVLIGLNAYMAYSVMKSGTLSEWPVEKPQPKPAPSYAHIQVEVLNGCGNAGAGQMALKYLRKQGFDVVNMENAEHFEFPETVVLDRTGKNIASEAAQAVAQALGTPHVILQRNDDRMVDVTAIIGRDYRQLRFYEE